MQRKERKSLLEVMRGFSAWYTRGGADEVTMHHSAIMRLSSVFKNAGLYSILDVACGGGKILKELALHGFEMTGTEILPELLQNELKKLSVFPCAVNDLEKILQLNDGEKFDVVILSDVLNYLRDEEEVRTCLRWSESLANKLFVVTIGGKPIDCIESLQLSWNDLISSNRHGLTDGRCVKTYTYKGVRIWLIWIGYKPSLSKLD